MKKTDGITKIFLGTVIASFILQGIGFILVLVKGTSLLELFIQTIASLGGVGLLFHTGKPFYGIIQRRVDKGFYDGKIVSYISKELRNYFIERRDNISAASHDKYPNVAMSACLKYLLSFLQSYNSDASYEISIFSNCEEPDIICYVDSNGRDVASSKERRRKNPYYYKERGYLAADLLIEPNNEVIIKKFEENPNYNTTATPKQKERIQEQFLYCFSSSSGKPSSGKPYVLVVVCDKENFFNENKEKIKEVIGTIGVILNSELLLKEKFCCNNSQKCENSPQLTH